MCFYTPLQAKEMRDLAHPPDKKKRGAMSAPRDAQKFHYRTELFCI